MPTIISNLTKKTLLMRSLLKRDSHFVWTSDMQRVLKTIKNDITSAVKLIHYDPNKAAMIETDASLKRIGAALIQDGKPVSFLSKALTPAETNWTNIERELLAILLACEKIHLREKSPSTQIVSPCRPSFRSQLAWHHPDCKECGCLSPNMTPK